MTIHGMHEIASKKGRWFTFDETKFYLMTSHDMTKNYLSRKSLFFLSNLEIIRFVKKNDQVLVDYFQVSLKLFRFYMIP